MTIDKSLEENCEEPQSEEERVYFFVWKGITRDTILKKMINV